MSELKILSNDISVAEAFDTLEKMLKGRLKFSGADGHYETKTFGRFTFMYKYDDGVFSSPQGTFHTQPSFSEFKIKVDGQVVARGSFSVTSSEYAFITQGEDPDRFYGTGGRDGDALAAEKSILGDSWSVSFINTGKRDKTIVPGESFGDGASTAWRHNDRFYFGDGDDTAHAAGGNDNIYGKKGNDKLFGQSGKDKIYGGTGKDRLNGGDGADFLDGGKGDDILIGQGDDDKFMFAKKYDRDKILDFENNVDIVVLNDNLWSGTKTVKQVLNQFGHARNGNFILDFGNGDVLNIKGTKKAQLLDDVHIV